MTADVPVWVLTTEVAAKGSHEHLPEFADGGGRMTTKRWRAFTLARLRKSFWVTRALDAEAECEKRRRR